MKQNIDIFNFSLTSEDKEQIGTLQTSDSQFFDHDDPKTVDFFEKLVKEWEIWYINQYKNIFFTLIELIGSIVSNIIAVVSLVVVLINKLIVSINFYMVLYLNLWDHSLCCGIETKIGFYFFGWYCNFELKWYT